MKTKLRRTDFRTDAGQQVIRNAHLNIWFRLAKCNKVIQWTFIKMKVGTNIWNKIKQVLKGKVARLNYVLISSYFNAKWYKYFLFTFSSNFCKWAKFSIFKSKALNLAQTCLLYNKTYTYNVVVLFLDCKFIENTPQWEIRIEGLWEVSFSD